MVARGQNTLSQNTRVGPDPSQVNSSQFQAHFPGPAAPACLQALDVEQHLLAQLVLVTPHVLHHLGDGRCMRSREKLTVIKLRHSTNTTHMVHHPGDGRRVAAMLPHVPKGRAQISVEELACG